MFFMPAALCRTVKAASSVFKIIKRQSKASQGICIFNTILILHAGLLTSGPDISPGGFTPTIIE